MPKKKKIVIQPKEKGIINTRLIHEHVKHITEVGANKKRTEHI